MTEPEAPEYRVLARKYRPTTFAGLIGQQAMVRTLTNAIASGRLAHAFILTGVRGVGKTTTARIIARVLNCTGAGAEPTAEPTAEPCGECEHCRAISEDRHIDVIEMDAASRTGVDDIRELIDGVRYRPVSARYKVYIIDEVHMLSKHAFNALLKTLEEPPEHVKFVFATTEIRKVPVTVLSRCQRFDLRRVETETLAAHFKEIAASEGVEASEVALHLIARAADGSVRDGLSLLDQAISDFPGGFAEDQVRDMLGLADRTRTFDLLEAVMKGDIKGALEQIAGDYEAGADPALILADMLELTHWLTRIKVVPETADAPGVPEAERVRGRRMAGELSMAAVARAWQMLLKGLGEVRQAPRPEQAAEMVLVRLAYAADLPTPAEAVKALGSEPPAKAVKALGGEPPAPAAAPARAEAAPEPNPPRAAVAGGGAGEPEFAPAPAPDPEPTAEAEEQPPDPATFQEVVELAARRREGILHANLIGDLHLVAFEPGRIEFRPGDHASSDLAHRLSRFLNQATARRWVVTVSNDRPGETTLHQQEEARSAASRTEAANHPLVKAVMETFPGATVEEVRPVGPGPESNKEESGP